MGSAWENAHRQSDNGDAVHDSSTYQVATTGSKGNSATTASADGKSVGTAGAIEKSRGTASAVLATVNGRPIYRDRVFDLVIHAHGAGVLEQLVVHDAAEQLAASRGLTVSDDEVEKEYDDSLRRLLDPYFLSGTEARFDRTKAEELLATLLSERNISRDEYMIGMRRNALLRKLVVADHPVSEEQLQAEFEVHRSEKVRVRHIQLASLSAVSTVQEALASGGNFSDLAVRHSANMVTGPQGGLTAPISRNDERYPKPLRDAAFALEPGKTSQAIRIGEWFHLIQVDERLPAREIRLEEVRSELERKVREEHAGKAMEELYSQLLRESRVDIGDPVLETEFRKRVRAMNDARSGSNSGVRPVR